MFLLKKLIGSFFLPLPVCVVLLILGLFFLWFTGRQRLGRILATIGTLMLLFFSNSVVGSLILRPLERPYFPLSTNSQAAPAATQAAINWIVVLGAGDTYSPSLPSTSQLRDASLSRVVEAVRLHREWPNSKVLLSEGTTNNNVSVAEVMGRAMQSLGVDQKDIVLEKQSLDTEQSARFVQSFVGTERFLLVTSASHMKRSEALFRKAGMDPIPAPADYESSGGLTPGLPDLYPNSLALHKADLAIHEYLGLAWARLRGRI